MNMNEYKWMLLVPAGKQETDEMLHAFYNGQQDEPNGQLLVAAGTAGYTAVYSNNADTDGLELVLAEELYGKLNKELYLQYNDYRSGLYKYYNGDVQEKIPGASLSAFGLEEFLPVIEKQIASPVKTIAVAEGTKPGEVIKLLGFDALPGGIVVEQLPGNNVLLYNPHSNISILAYDLSAQIPGKVYFIHNDTETKYFSCTVLEQGEEKGIYEYPGYITTYINELKQVNGEQEPKAIVASLGVQAELLFSE